MSISSLSQQSLLIGPFRHFLFLQFAHFSCKCNYKIHGLLCLVSFAQLAVFKVHQNLIFSSQRILHYIAVSHLCILPKCALFLFGYYQINSGAMKICIQILEQIQCLHFPWRVPKNGLFGSPSNSVVNFEEQSNCLQPFAFLKGMWISYFSIP